MDKIGVVDAWVQPHTKECAGRWTPEMAHVLKLFGRENTLLTGISIEEMVAEMEQAGVEKAVLSALMHPKGYIVPNEFVAEVINKYPGRFAGQFACDPRAGMKAVRELEKFVKQFNFKSLKIEPFIFYAPPNDKIYYPLYTKCCELDIPVTIQVGHTAPLLPSVTGRPIYLDEVALDFPELKIVAGHIGWPWTEEMISVAWKHPNVYIDTSAHTPKHYPSAFVQFLKTFGQEKCIFATDWPLLPFSRPIKEVEALSLPESVKRKFLRENALKVFKFH